MRRVLVLPLLLAATLSRAQDAMPASAAPPPEAAAAQSAPSPAAGPAARAPEAAPPAALAAWKKDERPLLEVSGYLQGRSTTSLDHDGSPAVSGAGAGATTSSAFSVARARIGASGEFVKGISYKVEGDFAKASNILTDGFARVTLVPHHEIRIGQQKTQFGYENPTGITRLLVVNRTFVSSALAREQNGANAASGDTRDIGVGVLGKVPVTRAVRLEWAGALVNGAGPNRTTDDGVAPQKDFWGRIGPTVKVGLAAVRVGASFGRGYDVGTTGPGTAGEPYRYLFRRVGADVQLDTPWLFAAGEYIRGTNALRSGEQVAEGGYLYAYGKTPWNVGPVARVEAFDPDRDATGDLRRRWTLGGYYDYRPVNVRLIVNYELDHSTVRHDDTLLMQAQVVF